MMAPLRLSVGALFAEDFLIQRSLSETGKVAVFEAEQKSSGRRVLLRVVEAGHFPSEEARARWLEGGKVASSQVPAVLASGVDGASGAAWVAFAGSGGESLAARLQREGRFPLEGWDELLSQVLHGLASLHQAGAVHGALSPAAIWLSSSSGELQVELHDVGLPISPEDTTLIGWAAPEVLQGGAASPAADVWSAAQLAFVLLSGKPFGAGREAASARARSFGATPPASLDPWFARCTQADPAARFPDAREALEGAADLLSEASGLAAEVMESEEPVQRKAAKPPPLPPMVRVIAENPKPAIAVILALVLLALGGGFGLGAMRGGDPKGAAAARAAAEKWAKGSFEECKAACEKGEASACHGLGQMYQYGTKTQKDEALAARHFETACSGKDGTACTSLAQLILGADGVKKDPVRASDYLRKGCDLGDAIGCADLAEMLASGNGVPKDEKGAGEYRARACKAGMTEVCR
jgi:TPR repeat protein